MSIYEPIKPGDKVICIASATRFGSRFTLDSVHTIEKYCDNPGLINKDNCVYIKHCTATGFRNFGAEMDGHVNLSDYFMPYIEVVHTKTLFTSKEILKTNIVKR